MNGILHRQLAHPLTVGMSINDPRTTALRVEIIRSKPFLRKLYEEWYRIIASQFPPEAVVLELGSGAGFLREFIPNLITSELFPMQGVDRVIDAQQIDMVDDSLGGIAMTDVFHHIPDCRRFFREASRVTRLRGRIVMIEPWVTPWSRWVYGRLHQEPFEPNSTNWTILNSGPLSGANVALAWMVFHRDRAVFESKYPQWRIVSIEPIMPLAYLLSGGVSLRSILPGWMYQPIRLMERLVSPEQCAMFAVIVLERVP